MFVEFELIMCVNIGELYYKLFKYKEALKWLLAAKDKPKGAYPDHVRLYNYVLISSTYLKLGDYKEAYNYFTLAAREVEGSSLRVTTLVTYYNNAALLFSELGKNEEASIYIHKALEIVSGEETQLKWDTGIIYEKIKLKEAKSETEVLDILEGVKYALSKYKNINTILDIVYSVCLQILELGYIELSCSFFNEFKASKSDVESINMKRVYLEAKLPPRY